MSSSSEQIRRALLERLIAVGVVPDMKNDDPAVRAVCAGLGVSPEVVVRELTQMRLEQGRKMMQRMGASGVSAGLLTMLSASRDVLLREAASFEEAYRRRSGQALDKLADDLGIGAGRVEARRPRREVAAA